jgi:hypothetical protein
LYNTPEDLYLQGWRELYLLRVQSGRKTNRGPLQWAPNVKHPGREADHFPSQVARLRRFGYIPPFHLASSWHGAP